MAQAFEIGVVMAGAVSAGAYTAGAMDFLFEALDAYYEARKQPDWDGPRHDVRIPIMTGASAGGMTAAIAALHAFRELEPVRCGAPPPPPERNRLYSSWVTDISLDRLLETADLTGERRNGGVVSALCCDVLDDIVARAFHLTGPVRRREWIGRDDDPTLRLRLTVTNLRGVPYSFEVFGADPGKRFGMLNHADFCEFAIGQGAGALDPARPEAPEWAAFRSAALASGAFPVGLAPRPLARPDVSFYRGEGAVGRFDDATGAFEQFTPDEDFKAAPYDFVAVDGGAIDNEPLELARRYLADEGGHNPRAGALAKKAVILIAPFPNIAAVPPAAPGVGLALALPAFGRALLQQARFKPDELSKAADETVFSRFMIAPARDGGGSQLAIACGALGGFSGFLHESFRRHDYLLGRRNAQAFLRWSFGLPESNTLFDLERIDLKRWRMREPPDTDPMSEKDSAKLALFAPEVGGKATKFGLPIIPLTDAMREPVAIGREDRPRPDLLRDSEGNYLSTSSDVIETRVRAVLETLVSVDLKTYVKSMNPLWSIGAGFVAKHFAAEIVTALSVKRIEAALDQIAAAFP